LNSCKLVAITHPRIEGIETAEQFIAYTARVSNPANQMNTETADKLIGYLIRNHHWSPFEMVHMTLEIKTTRDIARQILRHRSFSFQEFSQRYGVATDFVCREARLQDAKNRQNSIELDESNNVHNIWFLNKQAELLKDVQDIYDSALIRGIAKEQARAVLPEGLTGSTLYMSGTLRSWIHYCGLRMAHGTQKEHMEVARSAWNIVAEEFPNIVKAINEEV